MDGCTGWEGRRRVEDQHHPNGRRSFTVYIGLGTLLLIIILVVILT